MLLDGVNVGQAEKEIVFTQFKNESVTIKISMVQKRIFIINAIVSSS